MVHGFLIRNFDELVARAKANASSRRTGAATPAVESGITPLLGQLREAFRTERSALDLADGRAHSSAARHARALLEQGWSVSQVVREYGAVRDAITELAGSKGTPFGVEELGRLSRCLDAAIADAVEEYARLKDQATSHREIERLGQLGHDLRTQLQTALLSFRAVKTGKADVGGGAGDALGRSLSRLSELVDTRLSAARLAATSRVSLAAFVREIGVAAHRDAAHRDIRFTIQPGDPALAVDVDPQLLASALMSLLQNAFKYTPARGSVTLRTRSENGHAFLEVEDECGGMETSVVAGAPCRQGDRRGSERSAHGHGLAQSRRDAQANGGEVHAHNLPGKGCIFAIQLPVAAPLGGRD